MKFQSYLFRYDEKVSTGISAHERYFQKRNIGNVLSYDAAADGPEVPLIRFFTHHPDGGKHAPVPGFGCGWS